MENKKGNLYNDTVKKGDVALLGSAFGLGKKWNGFKSFHPYQLLILWAVTRRIFFVGHKSLNFYDMHAVINHPFLYSRKRLS